MMLHRVRALDAADRRLLARTGLMLVAARLGLLFLPYATLRRLLDGPSRAVPPAPPALAGRVAWAVGALARRLPGMTCLVQSLAAHALLARRGLRPVLHIGVSGGAAPLEAHAWVECDGRIVAGAVDELARYHVLRPPSVAPPAGTDRP